MKHEIKVPEPGESITEVFIGEWRKKSGDIVAKDDLLVELETEKTSFEIRAEVGGKLEILYPDPESKVKPGEVIATIDDSAHEKKAAGEDESHEEKDETAKDEVEKEDHKKQKEIRKAQEEDQKEGSAEDVDKDAEPELPPEAGERKPSESKRYTEKILSPAAKKLAEERGIDVASLTGSGKGGRITKEDVAQGPKAREKTGGETEGTSGSSPFTYTVDESRGEKRKRASRIRRTIAANLVAAQHQAAILTTFNEVDMSEVMDFRKKHNPAFQEKHGVKLGMVSFFARAAIRALNEFPEVNATFTGEDIIYRDFVDLSIAVSTDQGLVVPVIRDSETLSLEAFEKKLAQLQKKATEKKLSIEEMSGGTFTISNGGVFGSLLSTPILNMPQSAILGLHRIQDRPMVVDGEIEIRPMMYLALSYDHRIIDGREAVQFLVKIKEGIEDLYHIVSEDDLK